MALLIIILILLACVALLLLTWPESADEPFYIDDGIDHCKDCEICSKEHCKRCVFNRYNRK